MIREKEETAKQKDKVPAPATGPGDQRPNAATLQAIQGHSDDNNNNNNSKWPVPCTTNIN